MAAGGACADQRPSGPHGQQEVSAETLAAAHADPVPSRIEDPFLGFNELKCEWVGDRSWTYKVELPDVSAAKEGTKHVLAFDGLDTFATVKLNGATILESDNMWVMHRLDVTGKLHGGQPNLLEIDFKPALLEARKIKDARPEHKWVGFNGDMARLA
ncbi:hypothetical protein LTR53_019147, partial [Teratosphaeriaceae sp. CCFEE 6253]